MSRHLGSDSNDLPDDLIASISFDLIEQEKSPKTITAWVGRPYTSEGSAYCPCGLNVLGPERIDIVGESSMQALGLAMQFLHRRLSDELVNYHITEQQSGEVITQEYLDTIFAVS